MIPRFRLLHARVTALAVLVVSVAGLIGWLAHASWQKFGELREGLRLAQRFEEQVISLHNELNHLAADTTSESLRLLAERSQQLATWLEQERLDPATDRERRLLERTAAAYRGYLRALEELAFQSPSLATEDRRQQIVRLEEHLSRLLHESLAQFLDEIHRGLGVRQTMIFALLAALLAVLGWLSFTVYRGLIAPLRARLVEAGAAIEQSQKLASLGVLAAGIAHEIRNPLTAIKARLYTHQRALAPGSSALQDAEFIGRELNRLERIVREVLLFARPAEPALAPVSCRTLLRGVGDLLGGELRRGGIELHVEPGGDLVVTADAEHLEQVLINLVRNAADSIDPTTSGRIILQARAARMPLRGVTRDVGVIEVIDNGRGIPLEVRKKLFDPFFTTKSNGTGLGLAIAARIIDKHGGALRFQTEVNRGTTFGVVLPLAQKPA